MHLQQKLQIPAARTMAALRSTPALLASGEQRPMQKLADQILEEWGIDLQVIQLTAKSRAA